MCTLDWMSTAPELKPHAHPNKYKNKFVSQRQAQYHYTSTETLGFWPERLLFLFFWQKDWGGVELNGISSPWGTAKAELC